MKYIKDYESAKRKIISLFPDFAKYEFVENNIGWQNYIIEVDDTYIFRFPKNKKNLDEFKKEYSILTEISKYLPKEFFIPKYELVSFDDEPFGYYKKIKGKIFSSKEFNELNFEKKKELIYKIKEFLDIINKIDVSNLDLQRFDGNKFYKKLYKQIKETCYSLFSDEIKLFTDKIFSTYFNAKKDVTFKYSLIHGDLKLNHIIYNEKYIGFIDFGNVKIFDPVYDYTWVFNLDKEIIKMFLIDDDEYKRLQFYSLIVPYYQIIYGVKNKDNDKISRGFNKLLSNYEEYNGQL